MTQPAPNRPDQTDSEADEIRREEEAADRARGRSEGSGRAPKLEELDVPHPDTAPSAGEKDDPPIPG